MSHQHIPFYIGSALNCAIECPEEITEEDKSYLRLAHIAMDKLVVIERRLVTAKQAKSHQLSDERRENAGLSEEHPRWEQTDIRDIASVEVISAFHDLGLKEIGHFLQAMAMKESLVNNGFVIDNVKKTRRKHSAIGGQASALLSQKLLLMIENLAKAYCEKRRQTHPQQRLTMTAIAVAINEDVVSFMLNYPAHYQMTADEIASPTTCWRVDTILKKLRILKRAERLMPWFSPSQHK